ncbi:MAG: hypothetical protein R3195_19540 [Gemmatimonadota bacterium]|nr:hypothetical protein [Gemmatimonadota bacterium]
MDRRDYIMRMIEQLGAMLTALRRRILGGEATRAEIREQMHDAAKLGGLDYDLARAMSPETLLMMIAPGGEVDPGRCWLLAELSYLDGLEAQLSDGTDATDEARSAFERAAYLFGLLKPTAANFLGVPESAERLGDIAERLNSLPP